MDRKLEQGSLSFAEKIAIYVFICLFFYELSRASYWIINPEIAIYDSPLYIALNSTAPLWVWGLPFLLCAICLLMCSITLHRRDIGLAFNVFFLLSGVFGFASHLLLSAASMNNSLNWITPVQNISLAILFLLFTITGIESLWKKITRR